jgi:predicted permease
MLRDLLSEISYRLRALFRRSVAERELDDELRFHLEREAERYRQAGVAPEEATRLARIAFGGVEQVKEASRDVRGLQLFEQLSRDLAHSLRLVRKQPGFAGIVVLSLALGLGATIAVFNLTYNILFAPLAVSHPEQLIALERLVEDGSAETFTWGEYRALKDAPGVGTLVAARTASAISIAADQAPAYVNMYFVEGSFFPLLGIRPRAGRLLNPNDDAAQAPVAVISETFAARLFGVDSPAVGRTIAIRGAPFTVVGVTARSFRGLDFPGEFTAAIPLGAVPLLAQAGSGRDDHGVRYGLTDDRRSDAQAFIIIGRRVVPAEATRTALAQAFERCCARQLAGSHERLRVIDIRTGIPAGKNDFRGGARTILAILLAGMGLVLVVVCCNIASLLLVRASARQREIAVRLALGASRTRLVSQLILENLPLAGLGGLLGLLVAGWTTAGFARTLPSDWEGVTELFRFSAGPAVLVFTAAATLVCGIAFAVYPALRGTRQFLAQALRLDARASRTRGQGRVARGTVVGQIAFTVVLVTAASLLAATLGNLARVDGGFATDHLLLASVETRSTRYEQAGMTPLSDEILSRVRGVAGVRAAAMATQAPFFGGTNSWVAMEVPGYAVPAGKPLEVPLIASVPGYFAAMGIRLLSGRDFTAGDGAGGAPVVIVNAALMNRYFGGRNPVGRSIGVSLRGPQLSPARIVGVVGDAKYRDLRSGAEPLLYSPVAQTGETWNLLQLVVRTSGDPPQVARSVLRAVDSAAPGIQIRRVRDMQSQLDTATTVERLAARLALFVSVLALVLSAVGLYGVVSYSVARRTSEIGVRLALGARARGVLWLIAKETVVLVGIGVMLGVPLSFAASGAIGAQLFGVSAHDPFASAVAVLLLTTVGLLASVVPAGRATRIDPKIALTAD